MKACFAVLVDSHIHYYARKLAFQINEDFNIGFIAARLPQHVSLGPVFEVKDIKELEDYFDDLAKSIMPFEVNFTQIDLIIEGNDNDRLGVLWMDVKESNNLTSCDKKSPILYRWEMNCRLRSFTYKMYIAMI